eukprot:2504835-Rhodomonas_salina.2
MGKWGKLTSFSFFFSFCSCAPRWARVLPLKGTSVLSGYWVFFRVSGFRALCTSGEYNSTPGSFGGTSLVPEKALFRANQRGSSHWVGRFRSTGPGA